MKPVACFGEILLRLSSPHHRRLRQSLPGSLETSFAGAEANVAATLAGLGQAAELVTALPRNDVAEACLASLRAVGVGLRHVALVDQDRFGLFFAEPGANQLAGRVIYDRLGSSFSLAPPETYPWEAIVREAGWFHTTGISPGVSRPAAAATIAGVTAARRAGLQVSFDVNFRRQLWRWDPARGQEQLVRSTLAEILPHVTVLIGGVADLALIAGLNADHRIASAGDDPLQGPLSVARAVADRHPHLEHIAITLRGGLSADRQEWGALLFSPATGKTHAAPRRAEAYQPYSIWDVVDRIGTGDVFAGSLIFALRDPELADPGRALAFAAAASCLAHSVPGDFKLIRRAEVEALVAGGGSGQLMR